MKGRNPLFITGHFEIHSSQCVFIPQDIRNNTSFLVGSKLIIFQQHPHCNSCHWTFNRDTRINQGQTPTAHRCHTRRTVRFGNQRFNSNAVRKFLLARQGGQNSPLGKVAMPHFSALDASYPSRFANTTGRERVLQVKPLEGLSFDLFEPLAHTLVSQCGGGYRLRLSTREQRAPMDAWEDILIDINLSNFI